MKEKKSEKKKMKRGKKILLIVLCGILALILAALITVMIWGKMLLAKIPRLDGNQETLSQEEIDNIRAEKDPVDPDYTGPVYDSEDVGMPEDPANQVENSDSIINILLVGQDRRPGQGRQRSDAMILCTVNTKTKTLTMTSFVRDLWVRIPDYYDERLNVPYAIGGFKLLNQTLDYQFGISADYNVEVDFTGFEQVVDALGGVKITITSAEAAAMNRGTEWSLSAGEQNLNGEQALAYSRIRSIDNDFNRTGRQRTVLNAVLDKLRGKNAAEIYRIALDILPLITTDMTDSEIIDLIFELAPLLSDLEVVSQRIPVDGTYSFASVDGKSVVLLSPENLEKNREFIKATLGG